MKTILVTILQDLEKLDNFPKLKCPFCETGRLINDTTEKISYTNINSQKCYDVIGEPTVLIGEYSFMLICNDLDCGEKGIVAGTTKTIEDGYDDGIDHETGEELHPGFPIYKTKYNIDYISIPIRLIEIPANIGTELKNCLESSFNLFWVDINSCGTRIRLFIELLLDFINVPKNRNLNKRIAHLGSDKNNQHYLLAEKFMAIKYFGNETTHCFDQIEKEDLVKSYEVIEYCLQKIFVNYDSHIEKLSNELETKYNLDKK